jgi:transposase
MRNTKEILRLKALGRSHRDIARALGVGVATVSEAMGRARSAGLDWLAASTLSEADLDARLYPRVARSAARPLPDPASLDVELRKLGVTLRLLHHEYLEQHRDGAYGYTQFCEHYKAWKRTQLVTMRQVHVAGDKLFVDYSGKRPAIVAGATGEQVAVELFVAVLGASNYTFAEVTRTQTVADWTMSHVRALEYFGGVPAAIVPDQLKSGVTRPSRYDPGIQRTYDELAHHYGTVILPARPLTVTERACRWPTNPPD